MRLRLAGFSGMLLVTMAISTLAFFALAVIASEIQDEFEISKLQIGLLAAANTGVGGVLAPAGGRLSDRLGGRRSMGAVLLVSGTAAILIALAHTYLILLLGMALAGTTQGLANPSTNKAIATGIASSQRGILTGVKQSGVQLSVFASGFLMPWITDSYDWRTGIWLIAALSFAAIPGLFLITELPDSGHLDQSETAQRSSTRLPVFVTQVAIFGFLLGTVGGGLGRFLPLFAEEAAGFSPAAAGQVFGLAGLVAIPTRITSGVLLDRGVSARLMLTVMAIGGSVAVVSILLASSGHSGFLWAGTVLSGLTLGSWNTAANLSMIREGGNAGRATGRLMLGFLLGTTIGAPMVGWSIDAFDSYTPAWLVSAAMALAGAVVVSRQPAEADRYA
jgi:predicted MFS family arabinose efflux permease